MIIIERKVEKSSQLREKTKEFLKITKREKEREKKNLFAKRFSMKVFIATLSAIVLCALSAQFPRETLVGTMTTSFGVRFQDRTPGGNAGAAVTGVGDVDGDQIQDFAVSVPLAPSVMFSATNVGLVYIVYGVQNSSVASTVWGTDKNLSSFPANRVRLLDGYWPNTKAGWSIAAGDVNSDGLSDVIIGASPYNSFQGRVIIVFGKTRASATSPLSMYTPDGVSVSVFAGDTGSNFGVSVSTGDFDGDTISDIRSFPPCPSSPPSLPLICSLPFHSRWRRRGQWRRGEVVHHLWSHWPLVHNRGCSSQHRGLCPWRSDGRSCRF